MLSHSSKDTHARLFSSCVPLLTLIHSLPPSFSENDKLTDNWDDGEQYYRFRSGDILNSRYEVIGNQGKGVFSTVVRAIDKQTGRTVAIKVVRNNATMYRSGIKGV